MAYIDTDIFSADFIQQHTSNADVFLTVKKILDSVPIADVVEVVRCRDCDIPHNKWTGCPKLNGLIPPPDFYCAFGTPKTKDK